MERRHWGLLRNPFCEHAVAAKPFLVNDAFQRAYRDLLAAARAVRGCLLLTGGPGLGKTTLLRYLLRGLPFAGIIVETFPLQAVPASISALGPAQRRTVAAREQAQSEKDAEAAWPAFRERLAQRAREDRPIVLAVDDADALSDPMLRNMLAICGAPNNVGVPLNVLMTVTPSFAPRVRDLAQVSGCEIVQADLAALSEADVAAYVTQALARAGGRGSPFPAETIGRLSARSNGILANINLLCERALTLAEEAGSDVVTPEMIDRAAAGLIRTEADLDRRSSWPSDENREKDGQPTELDSASVPSELVIPTAAATAHLDHNGAPEFRGAGPVEAQNLAHRSIQPPYLATDVPGRHWAWAHLIAPGKGLAVNALRKLRSRPVPAQRFSRARMCTAAAIFMAIGGIALGWYLLRAQPGSPVVAGPAPVGAATHATVLAQAARIEPNPAQPLTTHAIAGTAEPTAVSETAASAEAIRPAAGKVDVAGPGAPAPDDRTPDARPGVAQTELPLLLSASSSASPPSGTANDTEIALLLARGDELLATSDAVSARLFYGRAAAQGSVAAMIAMAGTYDPLILSSREVRSVRPDVHEAISWYRRATAAGDIVAAGRLRALVDSRFGEVTPAEDSTLLRAAE